DGNDASGHTGLHEVENDPESWSNRVDRLFSAFPFASLLWACLDVGQAPGIQRPHWIFSTVLSCCDGRCCEVVLTCCNHKIESIPARGFCMVRQRTNRLLV